jgi:hypothetical protein
MRRHGRQERGPVTVVAGVVVETLPGMASVVAARLGRLPGLSVRGDDGDRRIAAVFTGADGASLEALGEELLQTDESIVGIFPTLVANEPRERAGARVVTSARHAE